MGKQRKQKIEIRTVHGTRKVPAVIVGALAAHGRLTNGGVSDFIFNITHLPSGFGFSADFHSLDDAIAAAGKIQHLRKDWEVFDPRMVSKTFLSSLKDIYNEYDAFVLKRTKDDPRRVLAETTYATDLNGYKSQDSMAVKSAQDS